MPEVRSSYPTLENTSTGDGEALASVVTGDSPTAKKASIAIGFRDSSGNLVLPQLDSEGRLPVSQNGAGIEKAAAGSLAAGSATMVDITSATLSLTVNKVYAQIVVTVSCFRDAVWNVVFVDNGVSTIIGRIHTGSGLPSYKWDANKKFVTAGATGTQTLKVQGMNATALSELDAEISCIELP